MSQSAPTPRPAPFSARGTGDATQVPGVWNTVVEIFQSRTVPEIRTYAEQIRVKVKQKDDELRQLVGSRYRDIVKSADSIIEMRKSGTSLQKTLQVMSTSIGDAKQGGRGAANDDANHDTSATDPGLRLVLDIVTRAPEVSYRLLQLNKRLLSTKLLLHSFRACSYQKEVNLALFERYPFLTDVMSVTNSLPAEIVKLTDECLSHVDIDGVQDYAEALVSLFMLSHANATDVGAADDVPHLPDADSVFDFFLQTRGKWIERISTSISRLSSALSRSESNAPLKRSPSADSLESASVTSLGTADTGSILNSYAGQGSETLLFRKVVQLFRDLVRSVLLTVLHTHEIFFKEYNSGADESKGSLFKELVSEDVDYDVLMGGSGYNDTIRTVMSANSDTGSINDVSVLIDEDKILSKCQEWVQENISIVRQCADKLLHMIPTCSGLQSLRRQLVDQVSIFTHLAEERKLRFNVDIWGDILQPLLKAYTEKLVQHRLQGLNVLTSIENILDRFDNSIESQKWECSVGSYVWAQAGHTSMQSQLQRDLNSFQEYNGEQTLSWHGCGSAASASSSAKGLYLETPAVISVFHQFQLQLRTIAEELMALFDIRKAHTHTKGDRARDRAHRRSGREQAARPGGGTLFSELMNIDQSDELLDVHMGDDLVSLCTSVHNHTIVSLERVATELHSKLHLLRKQIEKVDVGSRQGALGAEFERSMFKALFIGRVCRVFEELSRQTLAAAFDPITKVAVHISNIQVENSVRSPDPNSSGSDFGKIVGSRLDILRKRSKRESEQITVLQAKQNTLVSSLCSSLHGIQVKSVIPWERRLILSWMKGLEQILIDENWGSGSRDASWSAVSSSGSQHPPESSANGDGGKATSPKENAESARLPAGCSNALMDLLIQVCTSIHDQLGLNKMDSAVRAQLVSHMTYVVIHMYAALLNVSGDVNRIATEALRNEIHDDILQKEDLKNSVQSIVAYRERKGFTISEKDAIQILFDLRVLLSCIKPRGILVDGLECGAQSLTKLIQQIVSAMMDPINWVIYEKLLWQSVDKFLSRTHLLFGLLAGPRSYLRHSTSGSMPYEIPTAFQQRRSVPRTPYLPIAFAYPSQYTASNAILGGQGGSAAQGSIEQRLLEFERQISASDTAGPGSFLEQVGSRFTKLFAHSSTAGDSNPAHMDTVPASAAANHSQNGNVRGHTISAMDVLQG